MFSYLFVAYHWYVNAWPAFTHSVFSHHGNNWPAYWVVFFIFSGVNLIVAGVASEEDGDDDFFSFVRIWTMCEAVLFFWPWILLSTLPIIAGFFVGTIILAWSDKIPSKATRIERKQSKIDELQGDLAQLRSN